MTDRCAWCGRFGARPAKREVRGADGVWRVFTQPLCPSDHKAWTTDRPWNRPYDPTTEAD
jgi:hypothetical protein